MKSTTCWDNDNYPIEEITSAEREQFRDAALAILNNCDCMMIVAEQTRDGNVTFMQAARNNGIFGKAN